MPDIRILLRDEATSAFPAFGLQGLLPPLYTAKEFCGISLGLFDGSRVVGLACGVIPSDKKDLASLDRLVIEDAFRDAGTTLAMIQAFIRRALDLGALKTVWRYEIPAGSPDAYLKLCLRLPQHYIVEKKSLSRRYIGESEPVAAALSRNTWYNPSRFSEKGFVAIPWKDYGEDWKIEIRGRETPGQQGYLSPFRDIPFEGRTSMVLADAKTGAPAGWMMCTELSDSVVEINRYYVYEEYRRALVGPSFGSYVVEAIRGLYDYFSFKVVSGNRSMEAIVDKYFSSAMERIIDEAEIVIGARAAPG